MAYMLTVVKKNGESDYTCYRHAFKEEHIRNAMARDLENIFKDNGVTDCTVVSHSKKDDCKINGAVQYDSRFDGVNDNMFFGRILCFACESDLFMECFMDGRYTRWFRKSDEKYDPRYEQDDYEEEYDEDEEEEEEDEDDWDDDEDDE